MSKRTCGDCTKCCEGWLMTEVLGNKMYGGQPCPFVIPNKGCGIYAKRPKDPCQVYKCGWLTDENIPEWMKPSLTNAIVDYKMTDGVPYLNVTEAGQMLDSRVLTWLIKYAIANKMNFTWEIAGGRHWFGSPEFDTVMNKLLYKA